MNAKEHARLRERARDRAADSIATKEECRGRKDDRTGRHGKTRKP